MIDFEALVMPSRFHLRKWYFDLVADDGTAWIGYAGEVGTRAWHLRFSSSFLPKCEPEARTSLTFTEPSRDQSVLSWTSDSLGCRYTISADCSPIEKQLYSSDEGLVHWTCAIPSGEASFEGGGLSLRGRGYAERLEMTLPPWRLPLEVLQWGRFSGRQSLVWIRWSGPRPIDAAFLNGRQAATRRIDRDEISLVDGSRLSLSDHLVLRDAAIAKTLRSIGPVRRLLPQRLTASHEVKWRSRGVLERNGAAVDEGWVVHEHVTFASD